MFIKTLKDALPYLIKSNIPALVVGHHGIGKTQAVRQYADDTDSLLKILNLGTQEVGDVIGLADFLKDENGQNVATKFMMPDWAKEIHTFCVENPDKTAILFLDEINRARRDVLQVIFPLLTEKRIHATIFPSNFYVMGAMNPNTEDYIVTDINDKALLDRFCHIKLTPSTAEFFDHAESIKFDSDLIGFLKDQPTLLSAQNEDFNLDFVKPSRRSWEMVDSLKRIDTPMNLLQELSFGLVGQAATLAMMESFKNADKPFSAEDVYAKFDKIKDKVIEHSDAKTGGRQDLIKHTCDDLIKDSKGRKKALTKKEERNLLDYLKTIPEDIMFGTLRELYYEPTMQPHLDKDEGIKEKLRRARGQAKKDDKATKA